MNRVNPLRAFAVGLLLATVKRDYVLRFAAANEDVPVQYGVDVSTPMHHATVSVNYPWLPHNQDPASNPTPPQYENMVIQPLGNRQQAYEDLINGCRKKYGNRGCDEYERDRVAMNLRQPQSMQNYTEVGFKKIKCPSDLWNLISEFWSRNKQDNWEDLSDERWGKGNTYVNHWSSPSKIVSVEDGTLRGGGARLKQKLWNAAKMTIQEWTGEDLEQCSLYGIRVYTRGAVLASHVDRLPLVSSAIICVDTSLDEPWPLEVIGHDGKAHNVTMEPGDMVLYESHSIIHGRPFPLKGEFVANLFVHFEPTGHSLRHNAKVKQAGSVDRQYRDATERGLAGHEADHHGLPSYIIPGSPEEANWRHRHPDNKRSEVDSSSTGSTMAHHFAQKGNLEELMAVLEKEGSDLLHAEDVNGWQPIHEGVRSGNIDVVKYLHSKGADINKRTHKGIGGSPLWLARQTHGENHPVSLFLESAGALDVEPEPEL